MRDDLGDIENVPSVTKTINFRDDLDLEVPFGSLARIEGLHQISGGIVRISLQFTGFFSSEILDA